MACPSPQAALVKYSSFDIREGGKPVTYSQFETVDVAWADRVGSAGLDAVLMEHFAQEFDDKHMAGKGSVLDHPKAVAKLRKQVG